MIRDITRMQIEIKTAQGERVVMIEALPLGSDDSSYEHGHIPGAVQIPMNRVRHLAGAYIPNHGAEIVVYGQDYSSEEPDDIARQLSLLGYRNLYIYRGGKKDWLNAGEYEESVHYPPESGTHVHFSSQPQVPGLRLDKSLDAKRREGGADPGMSATGPGQPGRNPVTAVPVNGSGVDLRKYLGGAVAILAVYAGCQAVFGIIHQLKRRRVVRNALDADQRAKGFFTHQGHRVVRVDEDSGFEKEASAFNAASAAE
jgi:rhodanese-related sulfurtransferase